VPGAGEYVPRAAGGATGDQCAQLIVQLPAIHGSSPLATKDANRYYCSQTNGSVALAKRAGVEKSVLSRWLNVADARISLPMLLSIADSGDTRLRDRRSIGRRASFWSR
jgi:hypothetical protein